MRSIHQQDSKNGSAVVITPISTINSQGEVHYCTQPRRGCNKIINFKQLIPVSKISTHIRHPAQQKQLRLSHIREIQAVET